MKIFLAFILLLTLFSCGDDGPNCPGDMILPVEISPYKLFYNVGDTITVSSKFHKLIYDKKTEKFLDASNYNFGPIISFLALDSSFSYNVISKINEYSEFINASNSKINIVFYGRENSNSIIGEYELNGDSLFFQIQLKFKQKGNFWFKTESLTTGDSHLQNNFQFNCKGRYINFELVSPKDGNIILMQKFRANELILSDSVNRFYKHAGYCFEVR